MLKLMELEIKKFKIAKYIRSAIIINIVILGLLILLSYSSMFDDTVMFEDYTMLFSIIDVLVRGTFTVLASVMLARFVIGEFNTKSITVLFMYPIKRHKIIAAKLLVIVLFTFVCMILTTVVVSALYLTLNTFMNFITDSLTTTMLINQATKLGFNALSASFIALIPLYFGMRKYSVPTTIVSSVILITIICSNNLGFSLNDIIVVPIALAFVGAWIAYMSIRKIDRIDIG